MEGEEEEVSPARLPQTADCKRVVPAGSLLIPPSRSVRTLPSLSGVELAAQGELMQGRQGLWE